MLKAKDPVTTMRYTIETNKTSINVTIKVRKEEVVVVVDSPEEPSKEEELENHVRVVEHEVSEKSGMRYPKPRPRACAQDEKKAEVAVEESQRRLVAKHHKVGYERRVVGGARGQKRVGRVPSVGGGAGRERGQSSNGLDSEAVLLAGVSKMTCPKPAEVSARSEHVAESSDQKSVDQQREELCLRDKRIAELEQQVQALAAVEQGRTERCVLIQKFVQKLKAPELAVECEARGLCKEGRAPELRARLMLELAVRSDNCSACLCSQWGAKDMAVVEERLKLLDTKRLEAECRSRHLSDSGTKVELRMRLAMHE